jgi:4-amino-4-deoxy-L-arabinose transferase-like glycosyltransferase
MQYLRNEGRRVINLNEFSHKQRIFLLLLWTLGILWLRPWTGDLRSDPLTYACIAKDMVENNHWFSPMLEGQPYFNKPPFYFWFVAVSFKLFGISFYASQIPSLLFATVDVLFFYWIVYRLFEDYDLAFFSAFALVTTRWIVRNFTSNRPESLFLLSVLLGLYAFILMKEHNTKGPYLLGLSFAVGFLSKIFFAFFIPVFVLVFALDSKRLFAWLRWSHFYYGCLLGIILTVPFFLYYEAENPGYIAHLIGKQTVQRITEGADVNKDPFMYLKEIVRYYHPYLLFFILGIGILWKKPKQETYYPIFLALIALFIPLQLSTGKSDRYLTVITPFLSMVTALGIVRYAKVKQFAKKITTYGVIPFFIFFWIVPVTVNPKKFSVLHLAEQLSKEGHIQYQDPLYIFKSQTTRPNKKIRFVEWTPVQAGQEYRLTYYFYLSDTFEHWENEKLSAWIHDGGEPVMLLTATKHVQELPLRGVQWVEIDSDKSHTLFIGVTNRL